MNNNWHVCVVTSGMGDGGLRTGARVVCRINALGQVEVIGHGRTTAILPLRTAQACLECVRTPDWRPTRAANQVALSIRWDMLRGGRRFDMRKASLVA